MLVANACTVTFRGVLRGKMDRSMCSCSEGGVFFNFFEERFGESSLTRVFFDPQNFSSMKKAISFELCLAVTAFVVNVVAFAVFVGTFERQVLLKIVPASFDVIVDGTRVELLQSTHTYAPCMQVRGCIKIAAFGTCLVRAPTKSRSFVGATRNGLQRRTRPCTLIASMWRTTLTVTGQSITIRPIGALTISVCLAATLSRSQI